MSVELTLNIPDNDKPRVVIIGAGFAGLTLARKLKNKDYQVILIDRNNFHQFQPLFYQVAMAGLEPSSISFPLRKTFQGANNVYIRIAELESVDTDSNIICTSQGNLDYDYLVVATGAVTNYFGNKDIEEKSFGLKTVGEALQLRNQVLTDFEKSIQVPNYNDRQALIDIVIVGGGPTGVELAGSLAEMRKYILPKDYRELDSDEVDIYLIQGGPNLLMGMDEKLGKSAVDYLTKMGVKVMLNAKVTEIQKDHIITNTGEKIIAGKVIWAAGVTCNKIEGIDEIAVKRGNRLEVDEYNQLVGSENVFVLGDAAIMITDELKSGHPQVAQPAIQQAKNLAKNFIRLNSSKSRDKWKKFEYKDYGTMATVGRNKALVQLPNGTFKGFLAWLTWLLVHLYALVGVRNRLFVLLNWCWNYFTYDQSLRIILRPKTKKGQESRET